MDMKNNLLKIKNYVFLFTFAFLISCSSVGKRTVPESEVLSKDGVVQIGIQGVEKKFGETVNSENVGVYKRGYNNWKIILYGKNNFYLVFVTEDGKIVSVEQGSY
ncbi:hypothetical protein [Pseudoleptotrichia goodfellowii]|uniref:Uncharacterized protein n=2 Tax=Pseudoleptotrichia goodfellowii TaxID=157692 RepID=A0A510J900_9FUSO|nr:hypothetical protein [Pseudoleptotrichia goodfellowii]MBF4806962.1 hypothetical protein [Pseudoleptotrichia goodfellowii]BBM35792.1 hypothetical protein JCM16774_0722 [Pseudoleptotrichia goodfellowii]